MMDWISVDDRLPEYGVPVLIFANGTVQHVTYMLDCADDATPWFEPYYFEHDDELKTSYSNVDKWMLLPEQTPLTINDTIALM